MVLFGLTVIVSESPVEHGRQPADPVVPRAGGAVLRRRRRLRRPDRPAPRPHRDERPARRSRSSRLFFVGDNFAADPAAQHLHLDGHRVLRAGRGGDDPRGRAARDQLLAANGIFTLTLNAAFALGFALLGPLVINVAGAEAVILVVAALYFLAAVFCFTLPPSPPPAAARRRSRPGMPSARPQRAGHRDARPAPRGARFIRGHHSIGVVAAVPRDHRLAHRRARRPGPGLRRARRSGSQPKDFAVIVLPLGVGIVMGILLLNTYGKYLPRRRVIEGGLIALGRARWPLLSVAGPISRFLQQPSGPTSIVDLSAVTSLLAIVVFIAFVAGIAYARSPSRPRPSSRRTCRRRSAAASSAS